jgi:hypothetical protein
METFMSTQPALVEVIHPMSSVTMAYLVSLSEELVLRFPKLIGDKPGWRQVLAAAHRFIYY